VIENLKFFQDRMLLLNVPTSDAKSLGLSKDRTTTIVRKYIENMQTLRVARAETTTCIEAKPGKGDTVSLVVCERERFDELQTTIKATTERIKSLETAIERLDAMGATFLSDLQQRSLNASSSIIRQQSNIASYTSIFSARNPTKSPEEVLQLPEFVKKRAVAEGIIHNSQATLAELKAKITEIEAVLSAVGC